MMKETYFRHYGSALQEQAADLRKHMTEPERKLWFCFLKEHRPNFSCQKVIGPYIVDFFCSERHLAIELDGESHTETVYHDLEREKYLQEQGITVLHFTNQDVGNRFEGVCEAILQMASCAPSQGAVGEANGGSCAPFQGAVRRSLTGGCFDDITTTINVTTPRPASQATPLTGGTRRKLP